MKVIGRFTDRQLTQLRFQMSLITRIDPDSTSYKRMIAILDSLDTEQLLQIRNANIRFLSRLAINRLPVEAAR